MNLLWTELRKDAKGLREIGRWYRAEMMESAANEIDRLNARIKRLEEAGDALANHHLLVVTTYDKAKTHVSDWNKAKEAKP